MSKLTPIKISDCLENITDYHSNGAYKKLKENVTLLSEENYAVVVRTLNFEKGDFFDDLLYVTKEAYDFLAKSYVLPDDILMNKIANAGSVYIMPDINRPATCGMNLFLIRFKNIVNQRYMYYNMKNVEKYIKSLAHGTTTTTITKDEVRNIELFIHNIEEQNKIANILTDIDLKIENNLKINATLKDLSRTIYIQTFFNKKPNGVLGDIIIENRKSPVQVGTAKKGNGTYPFFTSGESLLKWNEPLVDGRNCFLNTGGNADIKFFVGKAAYSTDTWCITTKDNLSDYLFLLLDTIRKELDIKYFHGTGLKHLQKPLLKERPIFIPDEEEINSFNQNIQPMMDTISHNLTENQELASLRDFLLPLLMNGQVTFKESE